jgi:adenylyltransferase/sulfurtransferase
MNHKICIVGVGALGSHAAVALRNMQVLHLIDPDKVEVQNTRGQNHGIPGVRQSKVSALRDLLVGLWATRVEVFPVPVRKDNALALLDGSDIVLDCTDNADARLLLQSVCTAHKIPLLHGGLSGDGLFGQVMWTDRFTPDPAPPSQAATCLNGVNLPFHALVGAILASTAQTFLNTGKRLSWHVSPQGGTTRV